MKNVKTGIDRRSFIKNVSMAGGGLVLGFSFFNSCKPGSEPEQLAGEIPEEWFEINGYLKIGDNGVVTIMSPNPEGGQNVKTSMPMIVADELDVDWDMVLVEQAPLNTEAFSFQFIGGSQAIRRGWSGLRLAGASARQMLKEAAAAKWQVPVSEVTTHAGRLHHKSTDRSMGYGQVAAAASKLTVPEEVPLKEMADFNIIGTSRKNVDGLKMVTGAPMFGVDTQREGMLIAMIVHPPAFGLKIKSVDDTSARQMPGIKDIFTIEVFNDDYRKTFFDTRTFNEVAVIVGDSTWEVMQAKKALKISCEPIESSTETRDMFGREFREHTPAGLENTTDHYKQMEVMAGKPGEIRRKDGDPEAAFAKATKVIEATYTAPFLVHNCMEPMNFFADVTDEKAELIGPLQKPEFTEQTLSARLGMPLDKIDIKMTRLGGGYGRRSYAHWLTEAALISQRMKAPVKLLYTREDDMTDGVYRPMYRADFRAGLDKNNNLIAFHVKAGGIPQSPLTENRFPAGTVENYLAEEWTIDSNITVGSFRAPGSNFMACAEQSFLDEVAEAMGKDPVQLRLDLLERAINDPVGEDNDYDPDRYAGVIRLAREKSEWDRENPGAHKGFAAYFCHNTYVAEVLETVMENDQPVVNKVTAAVDCGIVVNPDAAVNMGEGAIVDGIGNAFYGELAFKDGVPDKANFDKYRMIRMGETPREINVHFVKNEHDPTGLGEPLFPPVFGALANSLYRATGKRYYHQPFSKDPGSKALKG